MIIKGVVREFFGCLRLGDKFKHEFLANLKVPLMLRRFC
jgi:hypothetical protein